VADNEQRWKGPTAEEVSAQEEAGQERTRGPVAWVRKLRLRGQVGSRRTVARAPTQFQSPPPSQRPTPPVPPPVLPVVQSPRSADQPDPPKAPNPVQKGVDITGPEAAGRESEAATDGSGTARRQIRISPEVRRRRVDRSGQAQSSTRHRPVRELTYGPSYGHCSCGEMFYGPRDVVTASYAEHRCGEARNDDRNDWIFDR
jgi:hypothetical protein